MCLDAASLITRSGLVAALGTDCKDFNQINSWRVLPLPINRSWSITVFWGHFRTIKKTKKKVRGSNTPGKVHSPAARENVLTKQGQILLSSDENFIRFVGGFDPDTLHAVEKLLVSFSCMRAVAFGNLELRLGICIRLLVNIILQHLNGAEAPV